MAADIGWACSLADCSDMAVTISDLDAYCEPFDVEIQKLRPADELLFISEAGFREWLTDRPAGVVRYADGTVGFETEAFLLLTPEDDARNFKPALQRRSPKIAVKCVGDSDLLAADIGPFITVGTDLPWAQYAFGVWLDVALPRLMVSLASELTRATLEIDFSGPPKVTLEGIADSGAATLGTSGFFALQSAVQWVYESDREVETRKKLFGIELARSVKNHANAYEAFRDGCSDALEGAKIAHQFGLADVSRDALKSMADLRKSVADETTKVAEATRQLSLSIAGTMFYGLGLIAARTVSIVSPYLLDAMALVGLGYVGAIILITHKNLQHQADLRTRWRGKFYEFLRTEDYRTMVTEPLEKSEESLVFSMKCAGGLSSLLFLAVVVHNHA
ncbi:hypothetical protein [Stenotrophomonas sp.]|uniref:hypothetical protein n=1 Tax=Stenotrophomonas sp. TaxID=69392 RepID=UPI002899F647|nr:hypothetical protein [Stenotrophomonas sp.]